jgi:prephenate dehydrogenase
VELGVVDRGATLEEAAQTADLIYLAQPILKIIEGMPARPECWVRGRR